MQYIATLVNGLTNDVRQVKINAIGPELAHRDVYFKHADKAEEIITIVDKNGDTMYTQEDGFTTMPGYIPGDVPEEIPVPPVEMISQPDEEKDLTL